MIVPSTYVICSTPPPPGKHSTQHPSQRFQPPTCPCNNVRAVLLMVIILIVYYVRTVVLGSVFWPKCAPLAGLNPQIIRSLRGALDDAFSFPQHREKLVPGHTMFAILLAHRQHYISSNFRGVYVLGMGVIVINDGVSMYGMRKSIVMSVHNITKVTRRYLAARCASMYCYYTIPYNPNNSFHDSQVHTMLGFSRPTGPLSPFSPLASPHLMWNRLSQTKALHLAILACVK